MTLWTDRTHVTSVVKGAHCMMYRLQIKWVGKKKAFHQACKSPAIIRNWYKACLACVGICRNNYQFYSGIGSLPYIFDLNGSAFCFFFQASAQAYYDEKNRGDSLTCGSSSY